MHPKPILFIAAMLNAKGLPVRRGSLSSTTPVDWTAPEARNAHATDGVMQARSRLPRDFAAFARAAARAGAWLPVA